MLIVKWEMINYLGPCIKQSLIFSLVVDYKHCMWKCFDPSYCGWEFFNNSTLIMCRHDYG
jgi:hypothetical protein